MAYWLGSYPVSVHQGRRLTGRDKVLPDHLVDKVNTRSRGRQMESCYATFIAEDNSRRYVSIWERKSILEGRLTLGLGGYDWSRWTSWIETDL